MAEQKFTTETLREKLFETIEGVQSGTVKVGEAQAIAKLSAEIAKTIDTEVKFAEALHLMKDRGQKTEELGPVILGQQTKLIEHES